MSMAGILHADVGAFAAAALAWHRLADGLDLAADDLSGRLPALWSAWRGRPAERAADRIAGHVGGAEEAVTVVRCVAEALAAHADELGRLREAAFQLLDSAGIPVDRDGVPQCRVVDESSARALNTYLFEVDRLLTAIGVLDLGTVSLLGSYVPPAARPGLPGLPAGDTAPAAVRAWWSSLSTSERLRLAAERPAEIGALDGIPVEFRHVANLAVLDGLVDSGGVPALSTLRQRLVESRDEPFRLYLVAVSGEADGRAVVAVGNPDVATNILTYVPGATADLSRVPLELDRTRRLAGDANAVDPSEVTAAVLWLGYDAPDSIFEARRGSYAEDAAPGLLRFQDGLRATSTGDPHQVVLGHSYGSTVVGQAARTGINADDLVFLGSPGVTVDQATQLRLTGDAAAHVWSATAENDIVLAANQGNGILPASALGGPVGLFLGAGAVALFDLDQRLVHGYNPSDPGFGGQVFSTAPGTSPWLDLGAAHEEYWDDGNPARANIAAIVVGAYAGVGREPGQG